MRRATPILIVLGVVGCGAGCGDGSHRGPQTPAARNAAVTTTTHGSVSAASASTTKPLTRSQARALVRAVNLRVSDLPGFKVSSEKEKETTAEKRLERRLLSCVGGALSGHGLAEGSSKEYERETSTGDESINSNVSVAPNAAIATRELKAVRGRQTEACLSRYVTLLFKLLAKSEGHGMTASPVQIAPLSLPAMGTTGSFGWRMSGTITLHGIRVPFDIDLSGFVVGQAEVTLFAARLPEPVPSATEQRLLALLVRRAEAHGA